MALLEDLQARSGSKCELCGATENLKIYEVPPVSTGGIDGSLLGCDTCLGQIEAPETMDPNHWRCLNDSMWSEHGAVQVVAWRMLSRLKSESSDLFCAGSCQTVYIMPIVPGGPPPSIAW